MCEAKTHTFGPIPVWTKKSATVWLFFPTSGILDTGGIKEARLSLEVAQSSGDLEMRAAMRTSNDGVTWSTPVEISTMTQANDGTSYGSGYIDLWDDVAFPSDALQNKQLVQFGTFIKNESGSGLANANATLRLTVRS